MVLKELDIHPGEILLEEFIKPYGLTATALARALGMPPNRITSIVSGDRSITPDTAILFAEVFNTSPEFWINLQAHYALERAQANVTPERVQKARDLHKKLELA